MTDYVYKGADLVDMIGFSAVNNKNGEECKIYGVQVFESKDPLILIHYTSETAVLKEDWVGVDDVNLLVDTDVEFYDDILDEDD